MVKIMHWQTWKQEMLHLFRNRGSIYIYIEVSSYDNAYLYEKWEWILRAITLMNKWCNSNKKWCNSKKRILEKKLIFFFSSKFFRDITLMNECCNSNSIVWLRLFSFLIFHVRSILMWSCPYMYIPQKYLSLIFFFWILLF